MQLDNPTTPRLGLIQQVQYAYKSNANWPAPGTPKWTQYQALANKYTSDWALDFNVQWNSLWRQDTYGPIEATVQAYPLNEDVISLSDGVYIYRLDGNIDQFSVVHPDAQNNYNILVASDSFVNNNGTFLSGGPLNLTLNFVSSFEGTGANTGEVGGTINCGVYAMPGTMTSASDPVLVDNPNWVVRMVAAELSRLDPAKQDQYPLLIAEANDLYEKMVSYNEGNSFQQPNGPTYNMKRLGISWNQY